MKKVLTILFLFFCVSKTQAQEKSMLDGVDDSSHITQKITGAFKSTRVINAHSTEMLAKRTLDVRILHRFGYVNTGVKQFFGLDIASMRMGFDYGLTNNIMIGIGRSTFRKELDAFTKIRVLQQATGYKAVPVSVLIAAGVSVWTEQSFATPKPTFSDRTAYYLQLIVGKKFTPKFSFQLSPIIVHSGSPVNIGDDKTIVALGGGGRVKVSKRTALTFDYHHPLGTLNAINTSPLSVGVDIETGGHVFQLQFSNATGMNERAYINQTYGKFFKGDIRFGFNLSRVFSIRKKQSKA
jgi:hypothetical protein